MPTITMTDDQAEIVVEALKDRRARLMCDWVDAFSGKSDDDTMSWREPESICSELDADIKAVVDVRRLIQDAIEFHEGFRTRREVAEKYRVDIDQIDAQNAKDEARLKDLAGKRIQLDFNINGKVYSGHFGSDIAEHLTNLCRRT